MKEFLLNRKKQFFLTVFSFLNLVLMGTGAYAKEEPKSKIQTKTKENKVEKIVTAPTLTLDQLNVTGAGGVNINTKACSKGYEILDNTNTGATSNIASPDGAVMSMTITLTNPQDGANEQLSVGGIFPGISVAGTGTATLTVTNTGTATISNFRSVLDDLIYKDIAANPNTVVQRQVSVTVTDALSQVSNTAIAFFNVTKGPNAGTTTSPVYVFAGDPNVNLSTYISGNDAGGTWVDVNATGALSGTTVNVAALPNGGSAFDYVVSGTSPCGPDKATVTIIKMNNVEVGLTSPNNCGVLMTSYTSAVFSANTNDPIFVNNLGGNAGQLTCPVGSGATTYVWYKFNPATKSYDPIAGTTNAQTGLADGGYLVIRTDAGGIKEGRAWIWNLPTGIPNAGPDVNACQGIAITLNGNIGGTTQTYTYYDPVNRPHIINASTKISITFNGVHTYVSDLGFFFLNPAQTTTVALAPNQGNTCNSGDNISNLIFTNNIATTYLNWCSPATAPLTGSWNGFFSGPAPAPASLGLIANTNYPVNWAAMYGEDAAKPGWAVQVYDCVSADIGSLTGVTFTFDFGGGDIITYTSGAINVAINDNSCTPATASIYVVPSSPLVTNTKTLTINPNIGIGGTTGGYQWSYSTAGVGGPYTNFNNSTLTPSQSFNVDTWVKLQVDNAVNSCLAEDILKVTVTPRSVAGTGSSQSYAISPTVFNLSTLLTGASTGGTWTLVSGTPGGGSFNAAAGTLNFATAGVGTYTFQYAFAANGPCPASSTTVTVTLFNTPIDAVNDPTLTSINGLVGGTTANITTNDTLNSVAVVVGTAPGNVTVSGVTVPAGLTLNSSGTITVAPNTPAGTYSVVYRICEVNNPTNCDTATATVTVTAPVIDAITDTTAPINGLPGGTTAALTSNDTLNGSPVVVGTAPGNVTVSAVGVLPTGLTLNANGTVTIAPNTPAGTYSVTYRICEVTNPTNCDTVTSSVVVTAPVILAVNDPTSSLVNGLTGGTTTSIITTNDTLNGAPVITGIAPGNVAVSAVTVPTGFVVNSNGTITVPANTPAGTYPVVYQICEINNPTNCSTATANVNVSAPVIVANSDTLSSINGLTGGNTSPVIANDTLNGGLVTVGTAPGNVQVTASTLPSGWIMNSNGTISVPPNTPGGSYPVSYTICEVNNPTNCSTSSSSIVVVGSPVILATTETTTPVNGLPGGTTAPLTVNDTLNGNPVTVGTAPGNVTVIPVGTLPTGLTLNTNGTVTIAPNTPAGTYPVTYRICEVTNPTNCSTVTSNVVVSAPVIDAIADSTTPVNGLTGGTSSPLTANDTLNGSPVVVGTAPGNVQITSSTVPVGSGLIVNSNGTVTVPANTPAGTYPVTYTICEVNNPSNCDTVTSNVVVSAPAIVAVNDTTAPVNGLTGGTTTGNITSNDTLNGAPVTLGTAPGNVQITSSTVPVGSGLVVNANGTITVAPNTPAGTYPVSYTICEITNPTNCSTATANVVVSPPAIVAVTDTTSPVLPGTNSTPLTSNDTLNGSPVVVGTAPGNVTVAAVGTPPVGLIVNPNGTVSVPANTPAGTYPVTYVICEVSNPTNCSTVTSNVVVGAPAIVAVNDTTAPVNGLPGGTTTAITTNDTLNGNPVTVGTAPGNVQITSSTVPVGSGLVVNANGTVTVAPNTPAGTYPVSYTICEVNNPTNCSTATANVVVSAPAIVAVTDTTAPVNGLPGGTTTPLTANDTLNGSPVTVGTAPGNVQVTASTLPSGWVMNPNGTVTIPANTPAGTYPVSYTICEVNNPTNCSTVSSSVVVSAPAIVAVTDTTTPVNGSTGGNTSPLTANDTLNGLPVTVGTAPGNVTVTPVGTYPTGLTLNPNGTVTVAPNTPAGTYPVTYTICEVSNPTNCSTVTSNVVVSAPAIIAVNDTTAPVNGLTGGTTTGNITSNDTLNGAPVTLGTAPGNVQITSSTVPVGSGLVVNASGTITVAPNTPAGTYPVSYTICEVTNPTNCSTATANVVVSPPAIVAVTDTTSPVLPGTNSTPLTSNDTLNGSPVVVGTAPGNVTVAAVGTPPAGLIVNPNGTVSVPANTPAGTYPVTYTICEVSNPTNCSTVTSNVVVAAPVILAVNDTTAPVNGLPGGTTTAITTNDTLNGNPVTVGTAPGNVQITSSTVPVGSGLVVNANGTVTVAPNTPAGTYPVSYTICEVNNPTNCSTATANVVVSAPAIVAVTDTTAPVNGLPGGTTTPLTANDTLNGSPVTVGTAPGNVQVTASTLPSGWVMNPNGTVTIPANTPAGTYPVSYTICEVNNPTNCSTVTSNVVVSAPAIVAVTENTTPVNGLPGGTTTPLTANDTLNGLPVTVGTASGNVQITSSSVPVGSGLIVNPNGTVTVPANTPAGTYPVTYTICEVSNPTNCSTVTSNVVVSAPAIVAVTDTTTPVNGLPGGNTSPLTANDTLNGTPVVVGTASGNVQITSSTVPVGSGLIVNPNGTVTVPANTPAGTYPVTYTICEVNNPTNCSTTTSNVVVSAPAIIAVADTTTPVNGSTGGTTTPLTANDTLNGSPVVVGTAPGNVQITSSTVPSGWVMNPSGTVTVPANTPAGTYPVTYTICEVSNPTNCSTVTSNVVVAAPVILAVNDTTAPVNGLPGGTTTAITTNDTLNGNPVTVGTAPGNVQITSSTVPVGSGLVVNANGTVTVAPNTPAGTYPVSYTICEVNNPTNCSTATANVVVSAPAIVAVTDTTAPVNGLPGGTTTPLTANDTLNGSPVTVGTAPGNVQVTASTLPSGWVMNPNGTVTIPANTPAGTYPVSYTICEVNNPTNCSTVTSNVVVSAPAIVAVTENTTPVNGLPGGTTTPLTANDTLNGLPVTVGTASGNVQITSSSVPVGSGLIVNPNGTVTVPANTPAGTYPVTYTICEVSNPTNCSTVTSNVVVSAPAIVAVTDTTTPVNGLPGGNTSPLTANDTLNGTPVVVGTASGNVQITSSTVPVGSGLIVNPNGTVTVPANTPAGTYPVTYTICEVNNPTNCSTTTSNVVVSAPAIIAVADTTTPVNGSTGGTTTPLTANDTLNGSPVVVGTAPGNVQITSSTVPSGWVMNPSGTVTVPANTPAGTYPVTYTICEVSNPTNCSTVTSNVVVAAPVILAVNDTTAPVNGLPGGTTTAITTNDTLNGNPVTVGTAPGNVQITSSTVPVGSGLVVNVNGTVTVAPNTPAGTYPVSYTICEVNNPTNCSTATANVVVSAPAIVAVTDTTAPVNGLPGGTTTPLTANDTLNGSPVTVGTAPGNVQVTASTLPSGWVMNPNGTVTIPANTPAGTYPVSYTICEVNNPTNCSTVTSNVVVSAPAIVAVTDTTTPVNGLPGGTTTPLTANDTLNGLSVTVGTAPGNVTVTPVGTYPTGLTLNPNGTVTVAPNTPAGTYPVTYTICEVSNPTNCSTVTSNVVVSAPAIIAVNDTTAPVNGLTGGTITTPITANDTLNGAPVVVGTAPGNVQITSYNVPSGSGIVVNPNGTVFVPANTPAGTYPVTYTICEVTNPTNCSTATTNVVVNAPSIVAVADTSGPVNGLTGGTTTTPVTVNDTLNGNPVVLGTAPGNVQITSSSLPSGWVMNPNGTVTVPANTIAGTYPITYTICEVTNPTNCSTVTSNIVVSPPAIITVVDTLGPISGSTGGTSTVTLTANDTLNGNPVVVGTAPGNVQITSSTVPVGSGLVVNPNGTVTVAPGTPPGTYPVTYTICEVTNPSNCSTITSNVVVSVITAYADNVGPINGLPGGTTVTLTTNDTLNNNPVVVGVAPGQVTVTLAPGPGSIPAGWVLNANGTVTVPANTPAGTYTVTYTICEVSNPSSCSTVTSNVVVTQPVILAVTDTTIPVNGLPGGTTTPLTTNDTLNGVAVVVGTAPGNVTVSAVGTLPAGLTLNSNGTVTIAPNTPAGTYPVTYTICEVNNPSNCSTVTSYVVVAMPNGLIVNNAVTPNGDGTNDVLYIEGIEFYPNNSVEVYNRWGVLVFETTGYDNKDKAFKGLSDGRITIQRQEELPVGTYYYILRYANAEGENKEQSGYLYINR